jgi:hypothetical protein
LGYSCFYEGVLAEDWRQRSTQRAVEPAEKRLLFAVDCTDGVDFLDEMDGGEGAASCDGIFGFPRETSLLSPIVAAMGEKTGLELLDNSH